ncbi:MAG: hypothetical protein WBB51_07470, partial [Candidatus Microthrix parvicella]
VNGFFSVLGSSTGTILSMSFGFNRTVVIGLLLYVVAAVLLSQRGGEPATDEQADPGVTGADDGMVEIDHPPMLRGS